MNKLLCTVVSAFTLAVSHAQNTSYPTSPDMLTEQQLIALNRIETLSLGLKQSRFYKNVSPSVFVEQLSDRIKHPYRLDQGKAYFCWAAAPIAYLYAQEPARMAEAVFDLYTKGVFTFPNGAKELHFYPRKHSIAAVGSATFGNNDSLSGKVVDQMVFLVFADNYKCWINLDRHFDPGDQSKSVWAGGTLSKEKRVWKDFSFDVEKHGFDLFWLKKDKAGIVDRSVADKKLTVLYVNAARFNKKWDRLRAIRRKPPFILTGSHYIIVKKIEHNNNEYIITFWDDDGIQQISLSHHLFQRSVFGIAMISIPTSQNSIAMNTSVY